MEGFLIDVKEFPDDREPCRRLSMLLLASAKANSASLRHQACVMYTLESYLDLLSSCEVRLGPQLQ